ncbi:hypothetical protein ccbrp13_55950 [Ktedonobacteria bacterium brp13]|nr:hypothetical protein ccbrp13_55950 [Ktedonobacteria bacterium brp13]
MDGREFQMRCWEMMESNLTTQEKMFMVAKFLYEGNPTIQRMTSGTGLDPQTIKNLELELLHKGWLVLND